MTCFRVSNILLLVGREFRENFRQSEKGVGGGEVKGNAVTLGNV